MYTCTHFCYKMVLLRDMGLLHCGIYTIGLIDPSHKSHNASGKYSTMHHTAMHHFVTEMCTPVHISFTKWSIVGYLSNALWNGSTQLIFSQHCWHWWPGAAATGHQQKHAWLITHPCMFLLMPCCNAGISDISSEQKKKKKWENIL